MNNISWACHEQKKEIRTGLNLPPTLCTLPAVFTIFQVQELFLAVKAIDTELNKAGEYRTCEILAQLVPHSKSCEDLGQTINAATRLGQFQDESTSVRSLDKMIASWIAYIATATR